MDIIKYMVVRICLVMGLIGLVWLGEMEYHKEKPVVWYGVVTQEIQGIAWPDGSWTDCTKVSPCGLPEDYTVDSMLEDGYAPRQEVKTVQEVRYGNR